MYNVILFTVIVILFSVVCDINHVKCDINQVKCDINQVILIRWNVILFRCRSKMFPTFPIKMGSKKIFFIQIITLWYNSSMTPELYHIFSENCDIIQSSRYYKYKYCRIVRKIYREYFHFYRTEFFVTRANCAKIWVANCFVVDIQTFQTFLTTIVKSFGIFDSVFFLYFLICFPPSFNVTYWGVIYSTHSPFWKPLVYLRS